MTNRHARITKYPTQKYNIVQVKTTKYRSKSDIFLDTQYIEENKILKIENQRAQ